MMCLSKKYSGLSIKTSKLNICLGLLIFWLLSLASGQQGWEMRVCANPQDYPVSSRSQEGFDNQIAGIVASELGAKLSFVWTTARGDEVVRRHLRSGDCDVFFGVTDGAMGLYSSVAYYRMPYVFLYRQDDGLDINSLYDERLADLRISTYPEGVPYSALLEVGLRDNLVLQRPDQDETGLNRFSPMMEALLAGETDVVIAYGSEAGEFLQQNPDKVKLAPVAPEITATGLQLFRILTIGVRAGDEALRDQLNLALARRWDDIQAVFAEYGIPVSSLPAPSEPRSRNDLEARVGIILPLATGNAKPTDVIGEAALMGAKMADDLVGREVSQTGVDLRLFMASAPNVEASVRAAERLISTDKVSVLIGGFNEEEARVLSEIAAERGVLFFNIGSPDSRLRGALCEETTFHIEASAAMYIDALVDWFASEDKTRWFLIYDTSAGRDRFERATDAVAEAGGEIVGAAEVEQQQFVYQDELEQLKAASPDAVLLLLTASDQELFLSQYEFEGLDYEVIGFPTETSQTRDFAFRVRQSAPTAARYRVALWETTVSQNGAQMINDRFVSRTGEPMEPAAWATYAAIKIAYETLAATGSTDATELIGFLENPETTFDVQKGPGISFRAWDHQLRQPLYLLEIDPDVPWSTALEDRVSVINLLGELPTLYLPNLSPSERLDRLGTGAEASMCRF